MHNFRVPSFSLPKLRPIRHLLEGFFRHFCRTFSKFRTHSQFVRSAKRMKSQPRRQDSHRSDFARVLNFLLENMLTFSKFYSK